jgi:CHAT domain-containing protein/tetratricopeptide (TPR) repeat protein
MLYNGHLSIEELEELIQQRGPAENQAHVQVCSQCKSLLADCQELSAKLSQLASVRMGGSNGMNCPDPRVWFDVAAGTLSPEDSLKHLQHAADCPSCGPKLRKATQLFQDELTPEEEKALAVLPSAVAQTQRKLAEQLAAATNQQPQPIVVKPKRRFWRPLYVTFATAAILVLTAFLSLGPITDSLLAHGYKERGTLELRIAKADPPKEGTRGADMEERVQPASLVLADLLIRSRLAFNPQNARWLGEKGRLELIEGKSLTALEDLTRAHALNPQSKVITIDLASAMIVHYSGHQEQPTELFQAQEELLKVLPRDSTDNAELRRDPDNLLAVYNLAVIYELIGSLPQAIQEWELYLKLDSNSPWADEARRRLERLKHGKHSKAPPSLSAPISGWAIYLSSGESNGSEAALDVALLQWIPKWLGNIEASEYKALLLRLAEELNDEHKDPWLSEFLGHSFSTSTAEAVASLNLAIDGNSRGEFDTAVAHAKRAEQLFANGGNIAGSARAKLEQIYSYQRSLRGRECIEVASQLRDIVDRQRFRWINIQVTLDKASCFNLLGRLQEAEMAAGDALTLARQSHYKILELRARGISAGTATTRGDNNTALALDIAGLQECWTKWYPAERAFQFYSDISLNTEAAKLWYSTKEAVGQTIRTISQTTHTELEAAAHYRLAKAELMLGRAEEALYQAEQADRLFSHLNQTETTKRYWADSVVLFATTELENTHEADAAHLLQKAVDDFHLGDTQSRLVIRRLRMLEGAMAAKIGDLKSAEKAYSEAIEVAERSLSSLKNPTDRFKWSRGNLLAYKALSELRLRRGNSTEALALWEAYRSVAVRQTDLYIQASPKQDFNGYLSLLGSQINDFRESLPRSAALISYAFLSSRLQWWLVKRTGIETGFIEFGGANLSTLIHRFVSECEDQTSNLNKLQVDAQQLYGMLIAPIAPALAGVQALIVEPDDTLESVPFEALMSDPNTYLIDRFAIFYSPGLLYKNFVRIPHAITRRTTALIVGSARPPLRWKSILPILPSAQFEAESIAARFDNSELLTETDVLYEDVVARLKTAEVFHYAGHALETSSGIGLVLFGSRETGEGRVLESEDFGALGVEHLSLLVLSSCGNSHRGFTSILSLLLQTHVPQIIVSRWNVASGTTQEFMNLFYKHLIHGASTPDSMREAARSTRMKSPHPYFWSPFFLFSGATVTEAR